MLPALDTFALAHGLGALATCAFVLGLRARGTCVLKWHQQHVFGGGRGGSAVSVYSSLSIPVLEVPVAWDGVGADADRGHGSTSLQSLVSVCRVLVRGASLVRDLVLIRVCYLVGVWRMDAEGVVPAVFRR